MSMGNISLNKSAIAKSGLPRINEDSGRGERHDEAADDLNGAADAHIVNQEADRLEQVGPIMHAARDEIEKLGARIGDVVADAQEVLSEPPQRAAGRGAFRELI